MLQRGTFKNLILGMFINSEWSAFGNPGSGHVRNSELGTTFDGHSELGAFRPGGAIGLKKPTGLSIYALVAKIELHKVA